ncbi:hypothetical protein K3N28_00250 [Glycomyces sp. TRM65418]|uniref:hypothetical protein n=1 Tax=Glycomyces sp. TRM65418 TaxID=2867006 RepID=UPI001CE6B581|nr:hypothetical protein [Glycomyces sp. TRM65418]MCC3761511.1 hypothetical protein [Glycomyces sp. TRM65418]QZD55609.1 hypothetical protein K3N28_00250 [Glycomyces sp. TRM65418]
MTIRSRWWASLAAAFAMVLAAGLGVAEPATAGPGSGDLAAADASEYGAVLDVQYESQPDGYVRTTEYENASVTEFQIASCQITVSANKPAKYGSQIRGSGNMRLSSGCSGAWEVLLHVQIYSIEWISQRTLRHTVYAPYSASFSTGADCKRGQWRTEIIVQRGGQDAASRSNVLNVTSC